VRVDVIAKVLPLLVGRAACACDINEERPQQALSDNSCSHHPHAHKQPRAPWSYPKRTIPRGAHDRPFVSTRVIVARVLIGHSRTCVLAQSPKCAAPRETSAMGQNAPPAPSCATFRHYLYRAAPKNRG